MQVPGDFEAPGLHAVQHVHQAGLDAVAASAFLLALGRRMRGLVLEHVHASLPILLGQHLARTLVML